MTACEGFLESVGPRVRGWAWMPADPDRRLRLSILLDSGSGHALRLDTVADLPRDDLKSAGRGDGRYGFDLAVPAAFADHEHDVDLRLPDFPGMRLRGAPRRAIPALGPVTLRAMHPANGDAERLWTFLAGMVHWNGGSVATGVPNLESIRSWLAASAQGTAGRCWLVAERGGRVIGQCRLGPDWPVMPESRGLALGIELHPDVRGRGLGHALMRAAERWAAGCCPRLELAVLPHNTRAQALYHRLGYADLGPVAHPVTGDIHRHMALSLPPRSLWNGVTLVL
ncbi:GNAT family N-acetyltransferase (plasmid) [Azospirillum brasilense]|nr:GNAT family N-acetyltransferase [Azospirillum brasilense]